MGFDAIVISSKDNVATVLRDVAAGDTAFVGVENEIREIVVQEPIAYGHKFAIRQIAKGDAILKYGEVMGRATHDIGPGRHAHVQNIESLRGRGDLETRGT